MFRIGCHLSASKGYLVMGEQAVAIEANTFQYFTRNPRGGAAKELDLKDVEKYLGLSTLAMIPAISEDETAKKRKSKRK